MPAAPIIVAVAVGSGAAAAIGGAVGAAIIGSAISATAATAIGAGIVAGTITAVQGGDASDVLKSAVLGGVTSYAGGLVGDYVGAAVAEATGSQLAGTVIGNVSSGITKAVITGQDIETGVLSGLAASVPGALKEIPGFSELPKAAQNAIVASASTAVAGGDVENALVNSIIMSSNIVGKAVSSIPEANEYFKQPENADTFRVLSATVNSALSASIQGKPVSAAVNKALINTTASVLQKAIDGGINTEIAAAKQKYVDAQAAENLLKGNIENYEAARTKYNAIAEQLQSKSKARQEAIDEYEAFKLEHEQGQGDLSTDQLNKIADQANAALTRANKITEDLNKYYEDNKDNLTKYKADVDKYAELQPKLEEKYNTAVGELDTASKAIVETNETVAKEVSDAVRTTVKNVIDNSEGGGGSYNETTGVWTLPDVIVWGEKDPQAGEWQSATADNGWEVAWNEKRGIIELYDPDVSLNDPVKVYTGKWGAGAKDSTGFFDQMSYFIDTAKDSFMRSSKQTGMLLFDVLPGMVAKATGNEDYFNKQMAEAAKTLQEINAKYPERVASYKDINGFKDALTYGVEAVTSAVVTTVPTLLMGGAAGVAARAAVKSTIDATLKRVLAEQAAKGVTGKAAMDIAQQAATKAAISTAAKFTTPAVLAGSAAQNIPEVFQNVYDAKDGKVDLTDVGVSTLVGTFNAALDAILPSALVDKLNLSKIPVEEVIGAWYKKAAKEGGSAFIKEGGTEAIQEMGSAAAESFLAENKAFFTAENLDRFIDAGLKGALGGSAISTSISVGQDIASGDKAAPTSQTLYNQGLDNTTPTEYNAVTTKLKDLGFDYTAEDVSAIAGTTNLTTPTAINNAVTAYADPRMLDRQEVLDAAKAEGVTLTDAQINNYVGRKDEATALAELQAELDPKGTTYDEARAFFRDVYGYTPTADEIRQFTNNITEEKAKSDIGAYVNPRQVTLDEARTFLTELGYNPTDAEVRKFVGQVNEATQKTAISEYVDPRMVDADEVRAAYATLGLTKPTEADIQELIGQYSESDLTGKAESYLPTARYNSIMEQLDSLALGGTASQDVLDAIELVRSDITEQVADLGLEVAKVDKSVNDARADLTSALADAAAGNTARFNDVDKAIADLKAAGLTEDQVNEIVTGVVGAPATDTTDATGLYKKLGDLGVDVSGLTEAVGKPPVADDPTTVGVDESQPGTGIYGRLDEIEASLGTKIETAEAAILKKMAEYEKAGISRDEALGKAIQDVATDLGTTKDALLDQIGKTETALREEIGTAKTELGTALTEVEANLLDRMAEYEKAGISRDEALQKSVEDLGLTLTQAELNILDRMTEYEKAGITRDEALQKAIADSQEALTTRIGETETNLATRIGETETNLTNQIQTVADFVGKPVRDVTQADIDFVNTVIAQQATTPDMTLTAEQLAYDINQDGIINNLDRDLLTQYITAGEPFTPPAGTVWAQPTGLYGELKDVETGLSGQITQTGQQLSSQLQQGLATTQQKANVNTLMQMLAGAPDIAGQQVTVKAPDPARIGYIYDWSSIFANPQQQRMFVTPYAQGGVVEDDDVTAELLRIIRS